MQQLECRVASQPPARHSRDGDGRTVRVFTAWNEFLAALVLFNTDAHFTVPVLLQNLTIGKFGTIDWGMLQVGVLVTSVPCILLSFSFSAITSRASSQDR
jgi:ABC-type glycerol-3-phosphate transport system permease component